MSKKKVRVPETHRLPCPRCPSSDAFSDYGDGWGHCFSCSANVRLDTDCVRTTNFMPMKLSNFSPITDFSFLPDRALSSDTCKRWKYAMDGDTQVACYYRDGEMVAQKLRRPDKRFEVRGDMSSSPLYGAHLWEDNGSRKRLVVTEGEIDCLSYAEITESKYPVVSVPNGAAGAAKAFKANLEWLESFEDVVIMFDSDEAGTSAAQECAAILAPGKARVARLPTGFKDLNELLVAGRGADIIKSMWDAPTWQPGGLITGADIYDTVLARQKAKPKTVAPYPYPSMNRKLRSGLWTRELVMLGAGTGVGKSTFLKETITSLAAAGEKVMIISLEEDLEETVQGLLTVRQSRAIYDLPPEEIDEAVRDSKEDVEWFNERVVIHDHWGSMETDALLSKIRYAVKGLGCSYVVLDHITLLISGRPGSNERMDIDYAMTALRKFSSESGCGMLIVSHLSRNDKKESSHEEGGRVTLRDFRGSHSLVQLSDVVIALERDTQSEENEPTVVRCLKKRKGGQAGVICALEYDCETGRLTEKTKFSEEF